jgi:hypothetical protein
VKRDKARIGPKPEPRSLGGRRPDVDILAASDPEDAAADESTSAEVGPIKFTREPTEHEVRLLLHIAAHMQIRFPNGAPHFTDEQMAEISGRMVFAYPTNWTIVEIGPAFDTKSLAEFWNVSPAKVRRRVADGTVFALKINGRYLYPDFQLDPVGRVSRKFFELVALVRPTFEDDAEMAQWLSAWPTQPSPAHLLASGRSDEAFARAHEQLATGKKDTAKNDDSA